MIEHVEQFDLDGALARHGAASKPVREDTLIPARIAERQPYRTLGFASIHPQGKWLFQYLTLLDQELGPRCAMLKRLIESHALCAVLENAFGWGNDRNPNKPICISYYSGSLGVLVRVEDAGRGFDSRYMIEDSRDLDRIDVSFDTEVTGHSRFGTRILSEDWILATYEGRSNVVYLEDALSADAALRA